MDFTGIGKIGSFVKQKNLVFAANYRMKTGQSIVDSSGRLQLTKSTMFSSVQASKTNSNSAADKARLATIKRKLKSGKKLSEAEMNYLREKDPSTYKKAKYADDAREELKSELRAAKTKEEAREAVMRAVAKVAADCSADFQALAQGGGGGGIAAGSNFGGGDISADMNFGGGDFSADTNFGGDVNLEGAGTENFSSGEISDITNSENISAQNENSVAQSSNENSDSELDILDKYIYAIRAIQDEWLQFIQSDEYKDMPENIFEVGTNSKNKKISNAQAVEAILAYRAAMDSAG